MERVDCGIPHRVSVNAWSDCAICYPGESFEVQVNAKCLNGCSLEGKALFCLTMPDVLLPVPCSESPMRPVASVLQR